MWDLVILSSIKDAEVPMQNVERLSITLPTEMARLIRAKVEQGGYASKVK